MKCNLFGTTTFDSPAAGAAYNATLDHLDDHLDVSMYCAYEISNLSPRFLKSNEMLHWRIVRSINMGELNWFNNQTATDPTTKQILQGNLVAKVFICWIPCTRFQTNDSPVALVPRTLWKKTKLTILLPDSTAGENKYERANTPNSKFQIPNSQFEPNSSNSSIGYKKIAEVTCIRMSITSSIGSINLSGNCDVTGTVPVHCPSCTSGPPFNVHRSGPLTRITRRNGDS